MTMIHLRDFDLEAARARFERRLDRERRLVFNFGIPDHLNTMTVRQIWARNLSAPVTKPTEMLETYVQYALQKLPVENGGAVAAVPGGYAALPEHLRPEVPLVEAWLRLRAHPAHGPFERVHFQRLEQPDTYPATDVGPQLESMFAANPVAWDLRAFEHAVLRGAKKAFGDELIDATADPNAIYPGSRIGAYMSILAESFIHDAFGALEPGFRRTDALVGEWWLLQPVSPRLDFYALARRFGLYCLGVVDPMHVDAPGRMVMACFVEDARSDEQRIDEIEDSKWIAGWKKVIWAHREPPLDDPTFDILPIELCIDGESSYRHSSELRPWPG